MTFERVLFGNNCLCLNGYLEAYAAMILTCVLAVVADEKRHLVPGQAPYFGFLLLLGVVILVTSWLRTSPALPWAFYCFDLRLTHRSESKVGLNGLGYFHEWWSGPSILWRRSGYVYQIIWIYNV